MPFNLAEWFGYSLSNHSADAQRNRQLEQCPFLEAPCTKRFNDGTRSGACSVTTNVGRTLAICPNRLYSSNYSVLSDVARVAFGPNASVIHPDTLGGAAHDGQQVVAFGKRFGRELKLPSQGGKRAYFVDWVLARIGTNGDLAEFIALEIQTIDTTGSYRREVDQLKAGAFPAGVSRAGLNWENVNKRILPQLIFKGHVLRREQLCMKGLFFVCPGPVYQAIVQRLGDNLLSYTNLQPGSISFIWYDLVEQRSGDFLLQQQGQFSTTVDQVALAFTSPVHLPEAGVYELAIRSALAQHR